MSVRSSYKVCGSCMPCGKRGVRMTRKHRAAIVKIPKASYNKGRWGL